MCKERDCFFSYLGMGQDFARSACGITLTPKRDSLKRLTEK